MTDNAFSSPDPLTAIRRARGTLLRVIALVLAVFAMLLPARTGTALGLAASITLPQLAGWAVLMPLAVLVGLIAPAVKPVAPFARLADIAAASVGLVASVVVFVSYFQARAQLEQVGTMPNPYTPIRPGQNALAGLGVSEGLGIAVWLLAAATLVLVVQAIRGGGRTQTGT